MENISDLSRGLETESAAPYPATMVFCISSVHFSLLPLSLPFQIAGQAALLFLSFGTLA